MKLSKLRIALAVLVVALIFGVLTLLFWTFVRDTIVIPIYYVIWVSGLVLKSVPQGLFAGMLAVIGLGIALSTLGSLPRPPNIGPSAKKVAQVDTRYQHWRRLTENLVGSRFSRNLFIADARRLILSILVYEHGSDAGEVEALAKSGELELPDGIRSLFQKPDHRELEAPPPPPQPLAARLRAWLCQALGRGETRPDPLLDPLVAEILTFVETHLENVYAGNQPEP